MKVFIIESSYPKDFYRGRLDGHATKGLLDILRIQSTLRVALDEHHFRKALKEASDEKADVLHVSCHGGDDGIALCNDYQPSWREFSSWFQELEHCPLALVMSACCGAADGIADAFEDRETRPKIIFGSTDELEYGDYAAAWSILYYRLSKEGVKREPAQTALQHIHAVIAGSFRYHRWREDDDTYAHYPSINKKYEVVNVR